MFAGLKHHRFTILAAASLIAFTITCFLWVHSEINPDFIELRANRYDKPDNVRCLYFAISSYSNTFSIDFDHRRFDPTYFSSRPSEETSTFLKEYPPGRHWLCYLHTNGAVTLIQGRDPGFQAAHRIWAPYAGFRSEWWTLSVPVWLPAGLFLVIPVLWLNRLWSVRRARRTGLCPTCGYDLRASPDRCPECGVPAKPRVTGSPSSS